MGRLTSALKHGWNAFLDQNPEDRVPASIGPSSSSRPDRARLRNGNERSIIAGIYTRMAIDFSSVEIRHVRLDENKRYVSDMTSGLNNCLTVEANIDQAPDLLKRDIALTMFEKGTMAIAPIETDVSPENTGGYDILTMRVGHILGWNPQKVKLSMYNEETGRDEEVMSGKKFTAIVENPFYSVMNEPNSTLQRLTRKLNLLDAVDEKNAGGKLDLIIQLPYVLKTEQKKEQADIRRQEIEDQLSLGRNGIAYTDASEKVIQLNRPAENNLLSQIEWLENLLYNQLGITKAIMDGTADEATMLNYHERTIKPLVEAVTQEMHRKFLTKTARTQGQAIAYFRDPFRLVPISQIAEIADKLTRNEIATSNEIRQILGWKPVVDDPRADQLRNSNMPQSELGVSETTPADTPVDETADEGDPFDAVNRVLDETFASLGVEE